MRALYVISNPFYYTKNPVGGSISSGTGVVNGLVGEGYRVDILSDDKMPTIKESGDISYIFFNSLYFRNWFFKKRSFVPNKLYSFIEGLLFRIVISLQISKIIKSNSYDLVYLRASHYAGNILDYSKKFKIPSILEVNKPLSMQPYNKPEGFKEIITKSALVKKIPQEIKQYELCDLISVDSTLRGKWIVDYVDEKYKSKIFINHNGVDQDLFKSLDLNKEINTRTIIGMASSFRWYNDIDELMRIISKVIGRDSNVLFKLFIGNNQMQELINHKIIKFGLEDFILSEYSIPLIQMPIKLSECEILISHFNFHGVWPHNCSIKHLEYMSMGKPVVATKVGEVNFAIEHEVNGLLVKEGDEDGFADSVLRLLRESHLRKELGDNGRQKVLEEYTWQRHVKKSLSKLQEIISETN